MPLILKAGGTRIYIRNTEGNAVPQLYGIRGWSHIKDRSQSSNQFVFDFPQPCVITGGRYLPQVRDEIYIYKSEADYADDIRWFGGMLTTVSDTMVQLSGSEFIAGYHFECQAFDVILDKELRQPQKSNMTWGALLEYILSTNFIGQLSTDYSFVQNDIAAPPIRINNGSVRTLLKAMRSLTGYDFYVDAYKRLHVFRVVDVDGSFVLEDEPASGMTVWDGRPSIARDARNIYNVVRQPFEDNVTLDEWEGETFTGKGDPKGSGGQLALLRTPASIQEEIYLQDKFDGAAFDPNLWTQTDDTGTHHVDYPGEGYIFPAMGQCQIVGGTGTLGGVALSSAAPYPWVEGSYIVQEFQLTNATGDGYICCFTDGGGVTLGHIMAGLRVLDGALKALDGTTLVAALGTTDNYIFWVTQTADGWQYDIQGGAFATKQTIRMETGVTPLTDYVIAPNINKNLQGSINSFRYRSSDRNVLLEINGLKKVVGLESSDTDLPDIDAFLNTDETPALLKFKAANALAVIASVASATVFTALAGEGPNFTPGSRLLIGDNIVEAFNGREAYVASVAGDVVTLISPGLSGMTAGQQVLVGSTVPAKDDKIVFKYGYVRADEATAADQDSIDTFGPYPVTLDLKDHIKRLDDAQMEAENYLGKYKDGVLTINFGSNSKLMTEPDSLTTIKVALNKRPDPINRNLTLQRVEVKALGPAGKEFSYNLFLESADPTTPLDDLVTTRNLIIGDNGSIRLSINGTDIEVANADDLVFHAVASRYITWANAEGRFYGEFFWAP